MAHTTYFDSSQLIDLGAAPNDNTGDTLRTAGSKMNSIVVDLDSALDALDSDFRVPFVTAQFADSAVTTAKIDDQAVTTAKIADGTITNIKYAGSLNFDSAAANDIITINSAGLVGINDTIPEYQLDITSATGASTVQFSSPSNTTINLHATSNSIGSQRFKIVSESNVLSINKQAGTAIYEYNEGTNATALMGHVNITGTQVGIGKNPGYPLDVQGTIQSINSGGTSGVRLNEAGGLEVTNTSTQAYVDFKNSLSDDFDARIQQDSTGLAFYTGGNGTAVRRVDITGDGKVGIGTSSPTTKLHINEGSMKVTSATGPRLGLDIQVADAAAAQVRVGNNTGNATFEKNDGYAAINISDSDEFRIYQSGNWTYRFQADGDFFASGDVTAFSSLSDKNLKENIENIPNALEKVSQLNGVTFNYIGSKDPMTGVIAQEVQEVLPEVIYETVDNTKEDGRALAVRYGNMVGLLIEAIKELKAEVEQLKNKE